MSYPVSIKIKIKISESLFCSFEKTKDNTRKMVQNFMKTKILEASVIVTFNQALIFNITIFNNSICIQSNDQRAFPLKWQLVIRLGRKKTWHIVSDISPWLTIKCSVNALIWMCLYIKSMQKHLEIYVLIEFLNLRIYENKNINQFSHFICHVIKPELSFVVNNSTCWMLFLCVY